eukprot:g41327.t1
MSSSLGDSRLNWAPQMALENVDIICECSEWPSFDFDVLYLRNKYKIVRCHMNFTPAISHPYSIGKLNQNYSVVLSSQEQSEHDNRTLCICFLLS